LCCSCADSEDERRVVKSAKEKTWETMKAHIGKLRNAMKIHDWNEIQNEFEALTKEYEKPKTKATISVEGNPGFFIKTLADLEDFLNETIRDKAAQKKMKPANVRAFNRVKLNLKKHNKGFEEEIQRFREVCRTPRSADAKSFGS
jgi:translation initiation factor 3 subunit C